MLGGGEGHLRDSFPFSCYFVESRSEGLQDGEDETEGAQGYEEGPLKGHSNQRDEYFRSMEQLGGAISSS